MKWKSGSICNLWLWFLEIARNGRQTIFYGKTFKINLLRLWIFWLVHYETRTSLVDVICLLSVCIYLQFELTFGGCHLGLKGDKWTSLQPRNCLIHKRAHCLCVSKNKCYNWVWFFSWLQHFGQICFQEPEDASISKRKSTTFAWASLS